MLLCQILAYTIHRKILKCDTKAINVTYQLELPDGSYSVSDIKIILRISQKIWRSADEPPIRIDVNKVENRIKFKIKTGYYLELLLPEVTKLSTKIR